MNELLIADREHRRREERRQRMEREERQRQWAMVARYAAGVIGAMYLIDKIGECVAPVAKVLGY